MKMMTSLDADKRRCEAPHLHFDPGFFGSPPPGGHVTALYGPLTAPRAWRLHSAVRPCSCSPFRRLPATPSPRTDSPPPNINKQVSAHRDLITLPHRVALPLNTNDTNMALVATFW
ncbi:hypothetical protein AAFF_G00077570 [Aldrovandia affinis]|uniref:Uncharacterized protein n=1 Tax=Aldrovandia affinis TaxID=143900 RepID=A0AAD7WDQ4_9TELE|nr:hypothetical protein AAFF_G00077570 [Aldrovandia affinis]